MGQRDLLRNLFPCLSNEERLRLKDGEVHLLEGHDAGDLPELVEETGAETHVLRRKVPSSARRVDVDDGISITVRRGGVAVGQCRGGCREEETAAAMDVAARERDSKAGGAEEQARAEEEEVPKRRRRRQRRAIDSTPLQIGAAASNRWEKVADGAAEIMRCDSLLGRAAGPHQAEAH